MLTQSLKGKVQELWDKFWAGGIANPLNAIEQITYLLFLKQLDENDTKKISNADFLGKTYKSIFSGKYLAAGEKEGSEIDKETLRWTSFTTLPDDEMYAFVQSKVFPFIKQLNGENSNFTKHMQNASFLIPSPRLLKEATKKIDEIYAELQTENRFIDAQGDFYEYLLDDLRRSGKNGQFRTPTHVIELIVELIDPSPQTKIADPASGTAGFLLGAYKYIVTKFTSPKYCQPDENGFIRGTLADKMPDKIKKQLEEETFFGFDIDPTMIRIGLMNMMMHGISEPRIDYKDTLSKGYKEEEVYDTILANPPFTGNVDKEDLSESFSIVSTKSELLFIERIYKMLRIGGKAGIVVPQGVLFGNSTAHKEIRKILVDKCELKAVISLPSGVFKPYAGVTTAILVFVKGGETKNIWFYDLKKDGWSLDDKRVPLFKTNGERDFGDLHDIIKQFKSPKKNTERTKQHFIVPKDEVVEKSYDLSINKYQVQVYPDLKLESPKVILSKLSKTEKEIQKNIKELERIIK
jgi:type I restriction enzyme M protein